MIKHLLTVVSLASVCLLLSSCKKDKEDPSPNAKLVGTYDGVSFTQSGCTDDSDNGSFTCDSGCDGVLVVTSTNITIDGDVYTYTATANTIVVTSGSASETATYVLAGNTLTITITESEADGGCTVVQVFEKQ